MSAEHGVDEATEGEPLETPTPAGRRAPVRPGVLYLVATPIGNLEDMTYRAVRVLREVDRVGAEDTRKARVLLSRYEIDRPTVSVFEGNEARRAEQVVGWLAAGESVALISEAGMPAISDPGARLVRACVEAGHEVDVVPGATAVTTAMVLSGFEGPGFSWLGFVPRKGAARRALLARVAASPDPCVLFEAPGRLGRTLRDLAGVAGGQRRAAVCRELTKRHQEIARGSLDELAERFAEAPRGEITLVVEGNATAGVFDDEALEAAVDERLRVGESPRTIADALGGAAGRRRVYQLALKRAGQASG